MWQAGAVVCWSSESHPWKVKVLVAQWCLTLCNPIDHSLPGYSTHGILQTRILEWVAISFSKGSPWPRDRTRVSCIASRLFTIWTTREAPYHPWNSREVSKQKIQMGDRLRVNFGHNRKEYCWGRKQWEKAEHWVRKVVSEEGEPENKMKKGHIEGLKIMI